MTSQFIQNQDENALLAQAGITPDGVDAIPDPAADATAAAPKAETPAAPAATTTITGEQPEQQAETVIEEPKKEEEPDYSGNDEEAPESRFLNTPHAHLLNDAWGVPQVDQLANESIRSAKKSDKGINFDLLNGHQVQWYQSPRGEFIGSVKKNVFDADDAAAIVSLSKTKGWNKINVHGSVTQREMLWLEAQRQGLAVGNFMPKPDSAAYKTWAEEKALKDAAEEKKQPEETPGTTPDAETPGTSQTPETPATPENKAPANKEAEAKEESPKIEAPVAETTAAEAPSAATPAAAVETPKAEAPEIKSSFLAPKAETPKAEEQKAEAPKAEAPKQTAGKPEIKPAQQTHGKFVKRNPKPKSDIRAIMHKAKQKNNKGPT